VTRSEHPHNGKATPYTIDRLGATKRDASRYSIVSRSEIWARIGADAGDSILMVENSGYGSEDLRAALGDSHRLLVDRDAQANSALGKGPSELALMRRALEHVNPRDEDYLITKVTGRLLVPNFASCISRDAFGFQLDLKTSLGPVDSRMFTMPASVLATSLPTMFNEINEQAGIYLEHVLRNAVLRGLANGTPWKGWRRLPRFIGVSGTSGSVYAGNSKQRQLHELHRTISSVRPFTL
jgi:hypothetical protein